MFKRFHYRRGDWRSHADAKKSLLIAMDDWAVCDLRGMSFLPSPRPGRAWVQFLGAHGLHTLDGYDSIVQVPEACLRETPPEEITKKMRRRWEKESRKRWKAIETTFPPIRKPSRKLHVGLDGMCQWAGVIVPAETGVVYAWICDGVALGRRSLEGAFLPLEATAAETLTSWGDNVYDQSGEIDTASFDDLLDEVLPGWRVDRKRMIASCEAALWVRCERNLREPVHPGDEREDEAAGLFDPWPVPAIDGEDSVDATMCWMGHAEGLRSPLAGDHHNQQASMIGARACLAWANSD